MKQSVFFVICHKPQKNDEVSLSDQRKKSKVVPENNIILQIEKSKEQEVGATEKDKMVTLAKELGLQVGDFFDSSNLELPLLTEFDGKDVSKHYFELEHQ